MAKGNQITDEEFLYQLRQHGGKKGALAKALGIGPSAVSNRLKRIKQTGGDAGLAKKKQREAAKAAVVIQKHIPKVTERDIAKMEKTEFGQGVICAGQQVSVLDKLGALYEQLDPVVGRISEEMKGNKRLAKVHVQMFTNLVRTANGLLTDIHAIRKDIFNMQGTLAFMEAVVRILERQVPDVQQQLFLELSQLGFSEQVVVLDPSEDSNVS